MNRYLSIKNINIVLFIFFLLINYFQPLAGDDLCRSVTAAFYNHTVVNNLMYDYYNWTGRITAQILVYIFFNEPYQPYLTTIFNIINSALFIFLINIMFKICIENNEGKKTPKNFLAFTFIFLLIFISSMLFQSSMWKTVGLQYFWGLCLILWLYYDQFYNPAPKITKGFIIFFIGLCLGLYNEIYFAILLIFSFSYLFVNIYKTKNNLKSRMFWFFLGNLLGGIILVIAPGNYVRQISLDFSTNHLSLYEKFCTLMHSYLHHELFLLIFLLSITLIILDKDKLSLVKTITVFALILMLLVLLPVGNNGIGGRVLMLQHIVLLIILFYYFFKSQTICFAIESKINIFAMIAVNLLMLSFIIIAYFSLYKFYQDRYNQIATYHNDGIKTATFKMHYSKMFGSFLRHEDPETNSSNWKNQCFAAYYHFNSVSMVK